MPRLNPQSIKALMSLFKVPGKKGLVLSEGHPVGALWKRMLNEHTIPSITEGQDLDTLSVVKKLKMFPTKEWSLPGYGEYYGRPDTTSFFPNEVLEHSARNPVPLPTLFESKTEPLPIRASMDQVIKYLQSVYRMYTNPYVR